MLTRRQTFIGLSAALIAAPGQAFAKGGVSLTSLPMGASVETVKAHLERCCRVTGGLTSGRFTVYETPVFERVFERQRLVLDTPDGQLSLVAAIVDPGFDDRLPEAFQDVFNALLSRHGRPDFDRNRGRFGPNTAVDLETGRFRRLYEWRVNGGTLRLGVPRRLDRRLRVEAHFARDLRLTTGSDWGLPLF